VQLAITRIESQADRFESFTTTKNLSTTSKDFAAEFLLLRSANEPQSEIGS